MYRANELAAMLFIFCHYESITNHNRFYQPHEEPRDIRNTNMEKYNNVLYTSFQVYSYLPVPINEITTAALKTIFGNELFILIPLDSSDSLKLMSVRETIVLLQSKYKWV